MDLRRILLFGLSKTRLKIKELKMIELLILLLLSEDLFYKKQYEAKKKEYGFDEKKGFDYGLCRKNRKKGKQI